LIDLRPERGELLMGVIAGTRTEVAAEAEEEHRKRRRDNDWNCKTTIRHTYSKFGSWNRSQLNIQLCAPRVRGLPFSLGTAHGFDRRSPAELPGITEL
jgi:hypothetical protein